jgi:hypothetical protein
LDWGCFFWITGSDPISFCRLEKDGIPPVQTFHESHSSPRGAVIALAAGLVAFGITVDSRARPFGILLLVVFAAIALMARVGFVYEFGPEGVAVRLLGFRLTRVLPAEIRDCEVVRIRPFVDVGGWGIRIRGGEHVYLLGGNSALRIQTERGSLTLGHAQPERLADHVREIMKMADA